MKKMLLFSIGLILLINNLQSEQWFYKSNETFFPYDSITKSQPLLASSAMAIHNDTIVISRLHSPVPVSLIILEANSFLSYNKCDLISQTELAILTH